ncbi:protein DELAY OF GERMINATION 1-like [Salvia hispanica]|uniref:protein DELAY OF GERMINATION 1-like n=1 Tax=Salvia hispanica TaxID=49212 RepID=UPI0020098929|nr:protein DELAY OF GERMINATION 1-like [Salvia hispanica]
MGEENFQEFYTKWIGEQRQQIGILLLASKSPSSSSSSSSPPLSVLVTRTLAHYEEYYATKSKCAKTDVFLLLSPPWTSRLEHAFIWIGGWRPTAAFHLLYSKSGLQLEARLSSGAQAEAAGLGNLSARQLGLIDELQRSTVREERRITEKEAKQQETVADAEMVELSGADVVEEERVGLALKGKEEGFEKVLRSADRLRMETLKAVVGILSPMQAVHFLIAAGELHLSLHEWGREKDERDGVQCNA